MNISDTSKNSLENVKEIPEFYRDLRQDKERPGVWHFTHRHLPGSKKPIQTEDNKPYKTPVDWKQMFPEHNGHIEIEVGSGKGGFLLEYAAKHPDIFTLGSEWDATWAYFAARRLQKKNVLDNSAMLRGDIFYFLRDCVADNTIDAFHMYFPDPWPKERHHKNRLLRPEFLTEVARVLKPGKRSFYWGTDHAEYNRVALDIFDHFTGAAVTQRNIAEPTDGIMTNFEKKYRKEGRPIYRSVVVFEK
jgi:tRNA (guanine-N7-)-methyltransferase